MPRARNPLRKQAKELWLESGGTRKLKDIAAALGLPESRVRKWKAEDKWDAGNTPESKGAEKHAAKRSAPIKNKSDCISPIASYVDALIAEALEGNTELTQQQKEFCRIYMRSLNATQAYMQSHNCQYSTANTEGPAALVNPRIRDELRRLREIKNDALGGLGDADLVELHMRIAFADITDFVRFGGKSQSVQLNDSDSVDGSLIAEVSSKADGAVKLKLADRHKSLAFLERYLEINPRDKHRDEYNRTRLELERAKLDLYKQRLSGKIKLDDDDAI